MNTMNSAALHAGGPLDRSLGAFGQHWHQPALPQDHEQPLAALAAGTRTLLCWLWDTGRKLAALLALWSQRERSRRELAELSDYLLRDVGLTRADVAREVSKPFWQA